MHNLFRKSIKIVAGFGLLLLYNCATVSLPTNEIVIKENSLSTLFSEDRKTLVYFNRQENITLIDYLTSSGVLDERSLSMLNKSHEVYAGFDLDTSNGLDAIIRGDFSKWSMELGLFFSFDWKKQSTNGFSYWINKNGLQLYFLDNEYIIISSFDITNIITNVEDSLIDSPNESIILMLPNMDDEQNRQLSNGFIKGGILNLSIYLDRIENEYSLSGVIGLESDSKARAFSRLINIFLKLMLSGSTDADIVRLSREFKLETEKNKVLVGNITINDKILVEMINSIILYDREADN